MNRRGAAALAAASVLTLGACGTTYVDSDITVPVTGDATTTTTTLPPVVEGAPLDELLVEIELQMRHLDEQIIEDRGQHVALERIDELWDEAERQIRDLDPDDVYNFEQTIELARTGVERIRPADASKGYKLLVDVVDAYLADYPA